jgi:hypothetical protein
VWDVTEPASPVRLGSTRLKHWGRETILSAFIPELHLSVRGDRALVASSEGDFEIVDLSDAAQPAVIGEIAVPDCGAAYDSAPVVVGDYAFLARGPGLAVVDVADPRTPREVANLSWGAPDRVVYTGPVVTVVGNRAFVANWDGIHVVDLSDPLAPRDLGIISTPGRPSALAARGGLLYVADREGGLLVLDAATVPGSPPTPEPTSTASQPGPTPTLARPNPTEAPRNHVVHLPWLGSLAPHD